MATIGRPSPIRDPLHLHGVHALLEARLLGGADLSFVASGAVEPAERVGETGADHITHLAGLTFVPGLGPPLRT